VSFGTTATNLRLEKLHNKVIVERWPAEVFVILNSQEIPLDAMRACSAPALQKPSSFSDMMKNPSLVHDRCFWPFSCMLFLTIMSSEGVRCKPTDSTCL
jgi:hypothetical protein